MTMAAVLSTLRQHESVIDVINGQLQVMMAQMAATAAQMQGLSNQAAAADGQLQALTVQTAETAAAISKMATVMEKWHASGPTASTGPAGPDPWAASAAAAAANGNPWAGPGAAASAAASAPRGPQGTSPSQWPAGAATGGFYDIRIDYKGSERITGFKGISSTYAAWKERAQEHMCRGKPALEALLRWAEQSPIRIDEAAESSYLLHGIEINATQASSELYSFTAHILGDEMRAKKLSAGAQRGLELWRSLFQEFEGNSAVVKLARLGRYLHPERAKTIEGLSASLSRLGPLALTIFR
jgi:hypothetical protein